jgi:N-acetylneuraminic acid mutarotase
MWVYGNYRELIKYDLINNKWGAVEYLGNIKPVKIFIYNKEKRTENSMIYKNEKSPSIVIFGGLNEEKKALNSLYSYDIDSKKWKKLKSCQYGSRNGHTAHFHNNNMYIIGGFYENENNFDNFILKYNFLLNKWVNLITFGEKPSLLKFHKTIINNKNELFLFGFLFILKFRGQSNYYFLFKVRIIVHLGIIWKLILMFLYLNY